MQKIFLVKLDHGNGWINYYQPTTVQKIKNFVTKRGCIQLTIKTEEVAEYQTMSWDDFKKLF